MEEPEPGAAVRSVLALLPLPALLVVDGGVARANRAAEVLIAPAGDVHGDGFAARLADPMSAARWDELLGVAADELPAPRILRWGADLPVLSLMATASRIDEQTVLVLLTDDREAQRLDAVVSAYNNAAIGLDRDQRILWMSRGMVEMYGAASEIGSLATELLHPDDLEHTRQRYQLTLDNPRRKVRNTYRAAHKDVPDVWWQLDSVSMNLLDDPAVGAVVSTFGPHTDLRPGDATSDLDPDAPQVMQLSDIMPVGILQSSPAGIVSFRNRLADRQLGPINLGDDALSFVERAHDDDQEPLRRAVKDALAGNRSEPVVSGFPSTTGRRWYRIEFTPQFDSAGEPAGWMATSLDVTAEIEARDELERAQAHLWHLANHDALTSLPNRAAMLRQVDEALARAPAGGGGVAVLFCDLDGFKPVNDRFGHDAGDEVLRIVAARMVETVAGDGAVGRLGGDELVVLCEGDVSVGSVEALTTRLATAVREPMPLPSGDVVGVGVSIGAAIATAGESSDQLIARADAAMYAAKPR